MNHRNSRSATAIGPRLAAIATGALTLAAASIAAAQTAPANPPDQPSTQPMPSTSTMQTDTQTTTTTTPPMQTPPVQTTQPPPVTTTQTTAAQYNENPPVGAEQQTTVTRPNPYLLGTGAILLAGPYAAGAIVAASNSTDYDDKLYWPVAGPWIDLGERPCTFATRCSNADNWNAALLIADGIAQGAGALMMVTSFFVPAKREIKEAKHEKPHVAVTPISLRGGAGIGAAGSF
jgi:hypothetical protein